MRVAYKMDGKSEVFTHIDDDGTMRHFAIWATNDVAARYGNKVEGVICTKVPIHAKAVDIITHRGGIEEPRIARLTPQYRDKPIIGIFWEDGLFMVVDGNHRLLRRWRDGFTDTKAFIFTHPFWRQFLIDLPVNKEKMTTWVKENGQSGII